MKELNLIQGTTLWKTTRAKYRTASEAGAMMGASKKVTRNELIRMKATGDEREFSDWVQKNLFDKGHEIEVKARPIAEKLIDETLYPVTATDDDGYLLASFDGKTMLDDVIWECKSWNEEKAAIVRDDAVPDADRWQLVQQLVISNAEKCLYMVTDGTEEKTVCCWVKLKDGEEEALLAGWTQFDKDIAAYKPPEAIPEPEGRAPETLPALHIEVRGEVTASNLAEVQMQAMAVFQRINTDLQTDADFADAEKTVKWCKEMESRLDAAKDHALGQTASIDELFRTIDAIRDEARAKRLELDKLVKVRKTAIRTELIQRGKIALETHAKELEIELDGYKLPAINCDLPGAIKGKRTIESLRNAIDTAVAGAKIEANQIAAVMRKNIKVLHAAVEHSFLFGDSHALITHDPEHFAMIVEKRISDHKAIEEKRLEAERERIRQEEERKAREKTEQEATQARAEATPSAIQPAAKSPPYRAQQPPSRSSSSQVPAKQQLRPSDKEIIEVLALHYRVHESKVIEWLISMDLDSASADLVSNF